MWQTHTQTYRHTNYKSKFIFPNFVFKTVSEFPPPPRHPREILQKVAAMISAVIRSLKSNFKELHVVVEIHVKFKVHHKIGVCRMLKDKAQIARESIKNRLYSRASMQGPWRSTKLQIHNDFCWCVWVYTSQNHYLLDLNVYHIFINNISFIFLYCTKPRLLKKIHRSSFDFCDVIKVKKKK